MVPATKPPNGLRWLQLAVGVLSVIVIPMLGYVVQMERRHGEAALRATETLARIEARIVAIEASRFTAADGALVWQALGNKIERGEVPPPWFLRLVESLEERIRVLETKH